MWRGTVVAIYIGAAAAESLVSVEEARAVAGRGLEGDRYFEGVGTWSRFPEPGRQISLIEIETLEALERDHRISLGLGDSRRNIVTQGVPLNHLVGHEFKVGTAVLRGFKLCEPCSHLASLTAPNVLPALIHRGGLRAEILIGGLIRIGDSVQAHGGEDRT
jgi:MOSC domain-containing protein YiiM